MSGLQKLKFDHNQHMIIIDIYVGNWIMPLPDFHFGFTVLLFVIATIFYWVGIFFHNEAREKVFYVGRCFLTASAVVSALVAILILYSFFSGAYTYTLTSRLIWDEILHAISFVLIFTMTFFGWWFHLKNKSVNFIFLLGLLCVSTFIYYGLDIALHVDKHIIKEAKVQIQTEKVKMTPTEKGFQRLIKIMPAAGFVPHESR